MQKLRHNSDSNPILNVFLKSRKKFSPLRDPEKTLKEVAPEVLKFRNGDKIIKNIIPMTKFENPNFQALFSSLIENI